MPRTDRKADGAGCWAALASAQPNGLTSHGMWAGHAARRRVSSFVGRRDQGRDS